MHGLNWSKVDRMNRIGLKWIEVDQLTKVDQTNGRNGLIWTGLMEIDRSGPSITELTKVD